MPGMALALSIFGVAFAAFCLWLTVRIVNRRERWAKRTAAGLVLLAWYPLSLFPIAWLERQGCFNRGARSTSSPGHIVRR
jgi:hypothetical protein